MDNEYKDNRFRPFYLHDRIICVDDSLLDDRVVDGPPLKLGDKYIIESIFSMDSLKTTYLKVKDDNGNRFTYNSTSFNPIEQHRNNSINEILS